MHSTIAHTISVVLLLTPHLGGHYGASLTQCTCTYLLLSVAHVRKCCCVCIAGVQRRGLHACPVIAASSSQYSHFPLTKMTELMIFTSNRSSRPTSAYETTN